jgi:hypothetical protein
MKELFENYTLFGGEFLFRHINIHSSVPEQSEKRGIKYSALNVTFLFFLLKVHLIVPQAH